MNQDPQKFWGQEAKRILKAEIKRRDLQYEQVRAELAKMGHVESRSSFSTKFYAHLFEKSLKFLPGALKN